MIESPVRIDVRSAQRTYPVLVGAGLLSNIGALFDEFRLANPAVVSVPPVWRPHGDRVAQLAGAAGPVIMQANAAAAMKAALLVQSIAGLPSCLVLFRLDSTTAAIVVHPPNLDPKRSCSACHSITLSARRT